MNRVGMYGKNLTTRVELPFPGFPGFVVKTSWISGWWQLKHFFSCSLPYPGDDGFQFDEHIFQMG